MENLKAKNIESIQSSITMIILLISFSMLFGTLFMGYMVYRVRATVWPPMGMNDLSLLYPSISTAVISLSSLSYYLFEHQIKNKNISSARYYLQVSLILGLGFCGSQFMVWNDLALRGITQGSGIFGSMIYGFTWIHVAHVMMGIFLLFWIAFKIKSIRVIEHKNQLRVKSVGMFWHFLGLVWFIMYLILFIF